MTPLLNSTRRLCHRYTRFEYLVLFRLLSFAAVFLAAGCEHSNRQKTQAIFAPVRISDRAVLKRILELNPERISAQEVTSLLSKCPAPRVLSFNGGVLNTMDEFSHFLIAMGYPAQYVRDPVLGTLSYSSYQSSEKVARNVSAVFGQEHLKPMLIGHSQGGCFVMEVLHRVKGKTVSYAAAIATGQLMRIMRGQWERLPLLRRVPNSVEEFSGYRLTGDPISSDLPLWAHSEDFYAEGTAQVHNVRLNGAGHLEIMRIRHLAADRYSRELINSYLPESRLNPDGKLLFAADIWHQVKKHWCIELQSAIRRFDLQLSTATVDLADAKPSPVYSQQLRVAPLFQKIP